jgi:hypothetical protein
VTRAASALPLLIALALALLGVLFLASPDMAFQLSGHAALALPGVMGGRYLAFAAVIAILLLLRNWQALLVVFGVGVVMADLDALLTYRAGGTIGPHLAAAIACLMAAWLCIRKLAEGPAR